MDIYDNIIYLAKALRMPAFRSYAKYIDPDRPFDENLLSLLRTEHDRREDASLKRRTRNAGFPHCKPLNTFKFPPTIPYLKKDTVLSLATCKFIEDNLNICAIGPSGTGKTHLMIAICLEAIRKGFTVKFFRVSDMLTMMEEARTEKSLGVMIKSLIKCNVLALDELGYIQLSSKRSQLLFDVIAKRCETGSSIYITSNYEFGKWPQFLGNSTLTNALVGKLTGASVILNMDGEDYRLFSKNN